MEKSLKIGFPEGTLLDKPLRLGVCALKNGVYAAIDKPAGILFDGYVGAPRGRSIMDALRTQKGKPELVRIGINDVYSVSQCDFEISGAALFAMNKDIAAKLRNAAWSGAFEYEFVLLARKCDAPDCFDVSLPIYMDEHTRIWNVSNRFGKKAKTIFTRIQTCKDYELWSAKSDYVRPHQIRLHAAERGLKIIGEKIYARGGNVLLSSLKGEYKLPRGEEREKPLYPALAIHLRKLSVKVSPDTADIGQISAVSPLPDKFAVMLKRIGFEFSECQLLAE